MIASMLKRPRTPPSNNPAMDYQTADSEHVMKRTRPFGISEEVHTISTCSAFITGSGSFKNLRYSSFNIFPLFSIFGLRFDLWLFCNLHLSIIDYGLLGFAICPWISNSSFMFIFTYFLSSLRDVPLCFCNYRPIASMTFFDIDCRPMISLSMYCQSHILDRAMGIPYFLLMICPKQLLQI